jgi:hypothetical protein
MLVIVAPLLGILFFAGLVLITLILGASARGAEKEALRRTEEERRAGLTGDVHTETPDPLHDRYVQT